jgi:hypothetical protein
VQQLEHLERVEGRRPSGARMHTLNNRAGEDRGGWEYETLGVRRRAESPGGQRAGGRAPLIAPRVAAKRSLIKFYYERGHKADRQPSRTSLPRPPLAPRASPLWARGRDK